MERPAHLKPRDIRAALSNPIQVAALLGLPAKLYGSGALVRCPAHADNGPSCSLSVGPDSTLRVRCFGCGLKGDLFHLIAAARGLDLATQFRDVLTFANGLLGVDAPEVIRASRAPRAIVDRAALVRVAHAVLSAGPLDGSVHVRDVELYLARRGVLRVARSEGWGAVLPATGDVVRRRVGDGAAEASGLYLPSLDDLTFAGVALAIPWRSPGGDIQALQRRFFPSGEYGFSRDAPALWPYGAHWTAEPDQPVAVVEGAVDALVYRATYGVRALGLPGVGAWSEAWAELFRGRVVLAATDADRAGDIAAEHLAERLRGTAKKVVRHRPEGSKDWSEAAENVVKHKPR